LVARLADQLADQLASSQKMALVLNFTPQRKIWDGRTNISECIFEALEATETNQPSHRAGRIRSSRVPNIHV